MERCRSRGIGKCRLEEKKVLRSSTGSGFTCTFELYLELSGASCRGVSMVALDVLGFGNCFRSEREENLLSGNCISVGSSLTLSSKCGVAEPIMNIDVWKRNISKLPFGSCLIDCPSYPVASERFAKAARSSSEGRYTSSY